MNPNNTPLKNNYNSANPGAIPKKGWKQILLRLKDRIGEDNVSIVSAGVAFYFFLALFPAIAAIVSIYGLVVDPPEVEQQLKQAADVLPAEAHEMISGILTQTAGKSTEALSWSLIISIMFSLWSANKATAAVFVGVNIAYHEADDRSFFLRTGVTLLFTLGAIITGIIAVAFVIAFPALIDKLGLPSLLQNGLALLRWAVLAGIVYFAFMLLYKYAPHRATPKMKWVNPGAIFATVVWMAGSLLFTLYINNFGNYDKTYGSIAAVIILMLWFYLTGFIILLGAELNSEIEYQTSVDTTTGYVKPMGQRGAHFADRVAEDDKDKGKANNR
jgi:membrane protein